jgi:tetratricopeptide (TPR) repeat protein
MAPDMVDYDGAGVSADQHRILADIAFYLSAARSAFAGSFKYQKDFYDIGQYENLEHGLRGAALQKMHELLLEELVSSLLEEPILASLGYSQGELKTIAEGILTTEILEEKKEERNYYVKARMVGDVESVTEHTKVLDEVDEKIKALKAAENRAAEANEHIEMLNKEIRALRGMILLGKGETDAEQEQRETLSGLIMKGDSWYRRGDLDEAIAAYTKALEANFSSVPALMKRGAAFLKNGNVDRALEDFDRALNLAPGNALSHVNRGCAFALKEEWDAAMKDLGRAIELDPHTGEAYLNRGIALLEQGIDYEAAENDLALYVGLNPGDHRGHLNRAIALSCMQQYDAALQEFEQTIQLKPSEMSAYYNRGNTYLKAGDLANALDDYTRVIHLDGVEGDVYYNRGIVYVMLGDMEKALDDFTRSIESYPLDAETYLRRGWVQARLGNVSLAIRDWKHAESLGNERAREYLERIADI